MNSHALTLKQDNMQPDSFLSESIGTLLAIAGGTKVVHDQSNIYLTPPSRCSFSWENIARLFKDSADTGEREPSELAQRSTSWFADSIRALAPILDAAELACHRIATGSTDTGNDGLVTLRALWAWTGRVEELAECLCECFGSSPTPTSAVESTLIIAAILERALGNLLRRNNLAVPFLLRDLLLQQPLYDIFGDVALIFTRLLVGMPSGLNARNLVWHGFVAPNEMPRKIPAGLLILLSSLGAKLSMVEDDLATPLSQIDNPISGLEELPETLLNNVENFKCSLSMLTIIPPVFIPFWESALERFSRDQFGRCLVLLLPQLELVLRLGFCVHNDCPRRLLTAVQSSPHTTLDDVLVETVDGKPNALCHVLGDGLLSVLLDLLQRPAGPRIRDRLGHGECALNIIPKNLARVLISVSIATASQLSKLASDPFHQLPLWENHSAIFHPSTLFLRSAKEVLSFVEKIDASVESASASVDEGDRNCDSSVDSLELVLNIRDNALEATRQHLDVRPASLFRPRKEIIVTTALWRTLRSLCVALSAAITEIDRRSSDVAAGRLRSRQRKTLGRMVQIAPTLSRNSVCIVVIAIWIHNDVARSPEQSTTWRRCIDHMEKYTEKLASYAHTSRNRWEEIRVLTSNFCNIAVPLVQNRR